MATRWRDLSDKEKGFFGGDKSTFQTALGRAADAGADLNRARSIEDYIPKSKPSPSPAPSPSPHQEAASRASTHSTNPSNNKLPDINTYDRTSYGSGAHKGTDKLSRADLKRLEDQGYSLQEIVDFADRSYMMEGSKGGGKALGLLNQFRDRLKSQNSQTLAQQPASQPIAQPPKEESGSGFTPQQKYDLANSFFQSGNEKTDSEVTVGSGPGTNISKINKQLAIDTGDVTIENSNVDGPVITGNYKVDNSLTAISGQGFLKNYMDNVAPSIDDGGTDDLTIPPATPTEGSGFNLSDENNQSAIDTGAITANNSYIGGPVVSGNATWDNSLSIVSHGGGSAGPGFNNMQLATLYNALDDRDQRIREQDGRTGSRMAGSVLAGVDKGTGFKPQDQIDNYYDSVQKSLGYNTAQANSMTGLLYGDIWNPSMSGMEWKIPKENKKPEVDYTKSDEIFSMLS